MKTTQIRTLTAEEIDAGIAANRFMHLLHHPEEQNRDGEQTGPASSLAPIAMTGQSMLPHLKILAKEKELAVTSKILSAADATAHEKKRVIAPWMKTATQTHKD